MDNVDDVDRGIYIDDVPLGRRTIIFADVIQFLDTVLAGGVVVVGSPGVASLLASPPAAEYNAGGVAGAAGRTWVEMEMEMERRATKDLGARQQRVLLSKERPRV